MRNMLLTGACNACPVGMAGAVEKASPFMERRGLLRVWSRRSYVRGRTPARPASFPGPRRAKVGHSDHQQAVSPLDHRRHLFLFRSHDDLPTEPLEH
jgi:hypothetical protein